MSLENVIFDEEVFGYDVWTVFYGGEVLDLGFG